MPKAKTKDKQKIIFENTTLYVRKLLDEFVFAVTRKFLIEESQLQLLPGAPPTKSLLCAYVTPARQTLCKGVAFSNGYCSKHQKIAVGVHSQKAKKEPKLKPKVITMTEQKIIDSMSTAVPNEVTVLVRDADTGLLMDPITEILFDDFYNVLGVKNKSKVGLLGANEVDICERQGWYYEDSVIDTTIDSFE